MRRLVILFVFSLALADCQDLGQLPLHGLIAVTGKPAYLAGEQVTYTMYNLGDATAYLTSCGGLRVDWIVDQKENGSWLPIRGAICQGIFLTVAIPLRPGESRLDSLEMSTAGTFRLRFPYAMSPTTPPTGYVSSNEIIVQ